MNNSWKRTSALMLVIAVLLQAFFANRVTVWAKDMELQSSKISVTELNIDTIDPCTYTGAAICPELIVKTQSGKRLSQGTDYTLFYYNNSTPGTATVMLSGIGNYIGTRNLGFLILEKNISDNDITVTVEDQTYIGAELTPDPSVYWGSVKLTKDVDYTVSYYNNKNVGSALIAIAGIGNYTGTRSASFEIKKVSTVTPGNQDNSEQESEETGKDNSSVRSLQIDSIPDQSYTGSGITPELVIKNEEGTLLVKGKDYTLSYINNVGLGMAIVSIKGIGSYQGTRLESFTIIGKSLQDKDISASVSSQTYRRSALTPAPTVKWNKTVLKKGTDYTLSYKDNVNVGTATITITGKGNFRGTRTLTFSINKKKISDSGISVSIKNQTYTGKELTPGATVKWGNTTLQKGKDYSLTYTNNVKVGDATVTITGMGSYTGSRKESFLILDKLILITLNGNGTKSSVKTSLAYANGHYFTIPAISWSGHKFLGWYTKKSGGKKVTSGTVYAKVKANTLYAHWSLVAPGNVSGVKVTAENNKKVKISWKKMSDVNGYIIYQSSSKNKGYKIAATINSGKTTSQTVTIAVGKTMYYKVIAFRKNDTETAAGDVTKAGSVTGKSVATPKVKMVKNSLTGELELTWGKIANAEKIEVATSINGEVKSTKVFDSKQKYMKIDKSSLKKGKKYRFAVRGYYLEGKKKIHGEWYGIESK